MPLEVILPKVDMDMETGVIVEWKVADGARVQQGDVLFEIETDKAMMEVESPGSGIIRELTPVTGEPIAVGTPVAWIYGQDETERKPQTAAPAPPAAAPGAAAPPAAAPSAATSSAAASSSGAPTAAAPPGEVRATPAARRMAREANIDLATISGSGPGGRVVEEDVTAVVTKAQPAAANLPPAAETSTQGRLIPFNPIQRVVAQRLAESMRTAPHFYLTAQIDMAALQDLQRRIEAEVVKAAGARASLTVLLAYIVGRVLIEHPRLNASVEGEAARLHPGAHIGIAVDRDGDLIVPVLRDVQARPLGELVREFVHLRDAARNGSIKPAQMRGSTFTLSNLGMYGVDTFSAIINPPECAILAIGRTADIPVGRGGQIVLRPIATFTLSSDHRVVDGVTAARFMSALRTAIESPRITV